MSTDRDTHFTGHADSIYPELARLFHSMYVSRILENEAQAKKAETWIKQYLAQSSYDLAMHVIGSLSSAEYDCEPNQAKLINYVEDMPALPKVEDSELDKLLMPYAHPIEVRHKLVEVEDKQLDKGHGVFKAVPTDGDYFHCYTCPDKSTVLVDTYLVDNDQFQSRRVWCQSCYDREYSSFNDESHEDVREIIYINVERLEVVKE